MKNLQNKLAALAVLALPSLSFAAVDADAITAIEGAGADIAVVGGAVFVVMVGIKLVKWIRRAL